MPLPCDSPSTDPRQDFCLALKAARERKRITLSEIAASTKIPAYLFAALERGDVRRWPKGLFRRSFFRDYVRAIGLPVAETCDEFVRLFPDEEKKDAATPAAAIEPAERSGHCRLALDAAWHGPRARFLVRLLAAAIDAATIVLSGLAIALGAGLDPPAVVTAVSLAYLIFGTVFLDETPGKFLIGHRRAILGALKQGPAPVAAAWKSGAHAITYLFGSSDAATPETAEAPPAREWITDARRVGPAPRLRVRIKVSP